MEEVVNTCSSSLSSLTEPPGAWAGETSTEGIEPASKWGVKQLRTVPVPLRSWRVHDSELGLFALTSHLDWVIKRKTAIVAPHR